MIDINGYNELNRNLKMEENNINDNLEIPMTPLMIEVIEFY